MNLNDDQIRKILSDRFAEAEAPVSPSVWNQVASSNAVGGGLSSGLKILLWSAAVVATAVAVVGVVSVRKDVVLETVQTKTKILVSDSTSVEQHPIPVDSVAVTEELVEKSVAPTSRISVASADKDVEAVEPDVRDSERQVSTTQELEHTKEEKQHESISGHESAQQAEVHGTIPINSKFTIISGIDPLEMFFVAEEKGANQYLWDFGDGDTSDNATPVHAYAEAGNYLVTLKITKNGNQVRETIQVGVYLPSAIVLPNTFSPNGDGINDEIDLSACTKNISGAIMLIYNTHGELIYEGTNWVGNNMQGDPCEAGTYTCVAQGQASSGEKITERQIIRLQR